MTNKRGALALVLGGLGVLFLMTRAKKVAGTAYRNLAVEFGQAAYPIAKVPGGALSATLKFEFKGPSAPIFIDWSLLKATIGRTLAISPPVVTLPAVADWTSMSIPLSVMSSTLIEGGLWDCVVSISRYDSVTARVGERVLYLKATGVYNFAPSITSYRSLTATFGRRT